MSAVSGTTLTRSNARRELTIDSIEDNVLITKDGYENLTDAIKEPGELEALISGS
jgi:hypothetical protein